ncbi:MAG TPA: hypothetical protein VM074_05895 [Solimonas sp.]|nr:hypothetical protein [Solimonas sp.]
MRVTPAIVENAVLQIFSERAIPAGGRLPYTDLRSHWRASRLRRDDLMQGVRNLVCARDLELEDEADGIELVLSQTGHERAGRIPAGPRGNWHQFVSNVWLGLARKGRPAPATSTKRRASDRAASA